MLCIRNCVLQRKLNWIEYISYVRISNNTLPVPLTDILLRSSILAKYGPLYDSFASNCLFKKSFIEVKVWSAVILLRMKKWLACLYYCWYFKSYTVWNRMVRPQWTLGDNGSLNVLSHVTVNKPFSICKIFIVLITCPSKSIIMVFIRNLSKK